MYTSLKRYTSFVEGDYDMNSVKRDLRSGMFLFYTIGNKEAAQKRMEQIGDYLEPDGIVRVVPVDHLPLVTQYLTLRDRIAA